MKRFKSQFRNVLNVVITLAMLLSYVSLSPVQAEELEPTILTDLVSTVSQDGVTISENGTIDSTKIIRVEISFGVPVMGDFDDPIPSDAQYVRQGDTVSFELSNAFTLLSNSAIDLRMGTIKVGTASFETDSVTNMVTATVTFDGDDEVFDGTSNLVTVEFIADFEFDENAFTGGSGDFLINILEKEYILNVPPLPIEYTVNKSGLVDLASQSVLWTVNLSALQGTNSIIDIAGLEFYDNLQSVGTYVPDSFEVNGAPVSLSNVDNTISYVFPATTNTPTEIKFRTSIPNNAYFATSQQNISNTAVLRQLDNEIVTILGQDQESVSFTPPTWITKTGVSSDSDGGAYNPTNRTITWTITANQAGATLNNVVITDELPSGLSLNNASWQTWNGTGWEASTSIIPNGSSQYSIGDINTMIRLTIVSNVPDQSFAAGTTTYNNSASITWDGLPVSAINSGVVPVTVGYNAISKTGVSDPLHQLIRWTVNVDARNQTIPNLRVVDLLVYGNTINLSTVTGIPVDINTEDLTPRFGQKYADNFVGNFSVNVIPIFQGSTRVADFIEITGLSTTEINTFSFDSQVVDPNIFAGNTGNTGTNVLNTATLFSGTTLLNEATGTVSYVNRMLDKRMLNRSTIANPAAGVNNSDTVNASNGFDYNEKTAIFRLSINADGIDLTNTTNASGTALGIVTVTDTLPIGWEFVEIMPGSDYLIFQGALSGGIVDAIDTTPDIVTGLNASISGNLATFIFQTLNQPYVILVKARLTDEYAEQYFSTNQTITRTNTSNLRTENWTPGVSETQSVTVTSTILNKSTVRPTAGELLWTVNYQPYNIDQPVNRIEDILPVGIDLRRNSSGTLIITGNITMYELTLNSNGTHNLGAEVPLVLGTNVNYNSSTRNLSFIVPDSSKAYRITYITDITGEPGSVTNRVSLYGTGSEIIGVQAPYTILASDGSASLLRNGWIRLTKIDGSGNPLANAQFTLFALDNTTVIKTGLTGSDGILTFRVIPDGNYILKETVIPVGYSTNNVSYSVNVRTEGSTVTSTIDGGTNLLSVQNFLVGTVGNLEIRKTVVGVGADTSKAFDFTLNLTGAPGTYNYVGNGVSGGSISSGDIVALAHGQSITILGLPLNATYSVIEEDYTVDGYTSSVQQIDGTIVVDDTQVASFTNTFNVGNLSITKTVTGYNPESTKLFDFIVTFDGASSTYRYLKSNSPDGTITSGDIISLADGQTITIIGLPIGASYSVSELDYSIDGYTTASASDTGTIEAGVTQIASFINNRDIGNLRISKTVVGNTIDSNKEFTFTLTLGDTQGTFVYIGENIANGSIQSGDEISLKHNQSITIIGLPMGTNFTVEEEDYTFDGYSTNPSVISGVIEVGETQEADFINTYNLGNLTIKKLVSGNASSTTKLFNFTITFEGAPDTYRYKGDGVEDGLIMSGDTISLAHNQSITIIGLPNGADYSIVEDDYTREGYSLVSTNATGTIEVGTTQLASFTNTRSFGLPQTGDFSSNNLAKLLLVFFSALLSFIMFRKTKSHK